MKLHFVLAIFLLFVVVSFGKKTTEKSAEKPTKTSEKNTGQKATEKSAGKSDGVKVIRYESYTLKKNLFSPRCSEFYWLFFFFFFFDLVSVPLFHNLMFLFMHSFILNQCRENEHDKVASCRACDAVFDYLFQELPSERKIFIHVPLQFKSRSIWGEGVRDE